MQDESFDSLPRRRRRGGYVLLRHGAEAGSAKTSSLMIPTISREQRGSVTQRRRRGAREPLPSGAAASNSLAARHACRASRAGEGRSASRRRLSSRRYCYIRPKLLEIDTTRCNTLNHEAHYVVGQLPLSGQLHLQGRRICRRSALWLLRHRV